MEDFLAWWTTVVVTLVFCMSAHLWWKRREVRRDTPAKRIFVPRGMTAEELRQYDGIQNELIFVGVKGVLYNVGKEFYGPGSPYNAFAGHEASRQLGKTKVGREEVNADWTTLSLEHLQTLDEWEERFMAKYTVVGWFLPDKGYVERATSFLP